MFQKLMIGLLFLTVPLFAACSSTAPYEKVAKEANQGKAMLQVGDHTVHEGYFEILSQLSPNFEVFYAQQDGRQKILEEIITYELLLQKARDEGIADGNALLNQRIWNIIRIQTAEEYLRQEMPVRARKYYEENKDQRFARVEIADIVYSFDKADGADSVQKKENAFNKAKATRKRLTAENFASVAVKETDDEWVRGQEGNLGTISVWDARVKSYGWEPLVAEGLRLNVGEISDPIITGEGVHIIMPLQENEIQPFEDVQDMLMLAVGDSIRKQVISELRAQYPVEIIDESLKVMQPEAAATSQAQ